MEGFCQVEAVHADDLYGILPAKKGALRLVSPRATFRGRAWLTTVTLRHIRAGQSDTGSGTLADGHPKSRQT